MNKTITVSNLIALKHCSFIEIWSSLNAVIPIFTQAWNGRQYVVDDWNRFEGKSTFVFMVFIMVYMLMTAIDDGNRSRCSEIIQDLKNIPHILSERNSKWRNSLTHGHVLGTINKYRVDRENMPWTGKYDLK